MAVVKEELIFVNKEFVEPNIAFAVKPATEFLYFASAPGAADNTLEFTRLPNCIGAVGGGVKLPVNGLGLPPNPYEAGHFGLYSNDGENADVFLSNESRRPVDVVFNPKPTNQKDEQFELKLLHVNINYSCEYIKR